MTYFIDPLGETAAVDDSATLGRRCQHIVTRNQESNLNPEVYRRLLYQKLSFSGAVVHNPQD